MPIGTVSHRQESVEHTCGSGDPGKPSILGTKRSKDLIFPRHRARPRLRGRREVQRRFISCGQTACWMSRTGLPFNRRPKPTLVAEWDRADREERLPSGRHACRRVAPAKKVRWVLARPGPVCRTLSGAVLARVESRREPFHGRTPQALGPRLTWWGRGWAASESRLSAEWVTYRQESLGNASPGGARRKTRRSALQTGY
jgi:hypothetical protein